MPKHRMKVWCLNVYTLMRRVYLVETAVLLRPENRAPATVDIIDGLISRTKPVTERFSTNVAVAPRGVFLSKLVVDLPRHYRRVFTVALR